MIKISMWRDEGPAVNGRGTPLEVENFNMKSVASYTQAYVASSTMKGAALTRPKERGEQTCSFTIYNYFRFEGEYNLIKNPKIIVSVSATGQTDKAQLFCRMTNVYKTPSSDYDPDMFLLANNTEILVPTLYPALSTVGPHEAVTRQTAYENISPLYTNYIVTQIRVPADTLIGNTPQFKLRFEFKEYGKF